MWAGPPEAVANVYQVKEEELQVHCEELKEQLRIGELPKEERQVLLQLLCKQHQVFAMTDSKPGKPVWLNTTFI